jgi:DNA replicative helicase MCM subunit Mcm2 (Cdc46/Mcm family)
LPDRNSKRIDEIADKRIHATDNKHNDENPHDEFKNHPGKLDEFIKYARHKINPKEFTDNTKIKLAE